MGCATGVVKLIVFVFNFLCAVVGLVLLTIGTIAYLGINQVAQISNSGANFTPVFVLSLGVVIFLISFLGCCGVCQQNQCMLITYSIILLLLFVLQLSISIYGYVQISKNDDIKAEVRRDMKQKIGDYYTNNIVKENFDYFQTEFKCCGVDGPGDYPKPEKPASCCKPTKSTSVVQNGVCLNHAHIYTDGCFEKVYEIVFHNMKIITYVALGICAVELVGAFFAICLVNSYRNDSSRGRY